MFNTYSNISSLNASKIIGLQGRNWGGDLEFMVSLIDNNG